MFTSSSLPCRGVLHQSGPKKQQGKNKTPVDGLIIPGDLCPLSEIISSNEQVNKGKT